MLTIEIVRQINPKLQKFFIVSAIIFICNYYNQCVALGVKTVNVSDTVILIDPPFLGFYSKFISAGGIPVRASNAIDNRALLFASEKVNMMLSHNGAVKRNLIFAGAELHIIGKDQQTSDLPELADQKNVKYVDRGSVTDIDKRTRGVGELYASCGEENLLQLSSDKYAGGYDICVHEFAHTFMTYGLDEALQLKIKNQYKKAINKGLWKNAYAASNEQEYWAELSTWYFGKRGEFLPGTQLPVPGPKGLNEYDTEGYQLLDSIYSGMLQPTLNKLSFVVMKGVVSGLSTKRAKIRLANNRTDSIKLYWIDRQGNASLQTVVPPKINIVQATFFSHVWMIANAQGAALVYVRVNDSTCNITLKDTPDTDKLILQQAETRKATGNVSGESLIKAELSVNNSRANMIKLYWINWNGGKELYRIMPPKDKININTFISHLWLIEDEKGKMLGYARVNSTGSNLIIGDKGLKITPDKNK